MPSKFTKITYLERIGAIQERFGEPKLWGQSSQERYIPFFFLNSGEALWQAFIPPTPPNRANGHRGRSEFPPARIQQRYLPERAAEATATADCPTSPSAGRAGPRARRSAARRRSGSSGRPGRPAPGRRTTGWPGRRSCDRRWRPRSRPDRSAAGPWRRRPGPEPSGRKTRSRIDGRTPRTGRADRDDSRGQRDRSRFRRAPIYFRGRPQRENSATVGASSVIAEAASAKFEKSRKANSQLEDTSGWILARRRFPMIGRNPDHPMRQRRGTDGDGRTRIGHRRCAANPQQRRGYATAPVLPRARSEKSRPSFPSREQHCSSSFSEFPFQPKVYLQPWFQTTPLR